jgi:hypothetical protein
MQSSRYLIIFFVMKNLQDAGIDNVFFWINPVEKTSWRLLVAPLAAPSIIKQVSQYKSTFQLKWTWWWAYHSARFQRFICNKLILDKKANFPFIRILAASTSKMMNASINNPCSTVLHHSTKLKSWLNIHNQNTHERSWWLPNSNVLV